MATPRRMVHLRCTCGGTQWTMDGDFGGIGGVHKSIPYGERSYTCPRCNETRVGFTVLGKSPPILTLAPQSKSVLPTSERDYWVRVLREHFPDDPYLEAACDDEEH